MNRRPTSASIQIPLILDRLAGHHLFSDLVLLGGLLTYGIAWLVTALFMRRAAQ